jgi:hypothetical protein
MAKNPRGLKGMLGNKNSVGNEGGRPTKFNKAFCDQVTKYCLLGATDEDLASFLDVTVTTISNWKTAQPEFFNAIKEGREIADANVGRRLYERAMGFEHDSEEIKIMNDPVIGQYVERVPVRKIYPPDPTSMIFWLKNRQRTKWRDKIETGITDTEGNDLKQPLINIQVVQPKPDIPENEETENI